MDLQNAQPLLGRFAEQWLECCWLPVDTRARAPTLLVGHEFQLVHKQDFGSQSGRTSAERCGHCFLAITREQVPTEGLVLALREPQFSSHAAFLSSRTSHSSTSSRCVSMQSKPRLHGFAAVR